MELFTLLGVGIGVDQDFTVSSGWTFKNRRLVVDYPNFGLRAFNIESFIATKFTDSFPQVTIKNGFFRPKIGLVRDRHEEDNAHKFTVMIIVNGFVDIDKGFINDGKIKSIRRVDNSPTAIVVATLFKDNDDLTFDVHDTETGHSKSIYLAYDNRSRNLIVADYSKANLERVMPEKVITLWSKTCDYAHSVFRRFFFGFKSL